jgi:hypothetical protein
MAHAAARRRGAAGDEADSRLGTTLFSLVGEELGASSSAEPPISPIMMIDLVSSSARNSSSTSMKLVPLTGSPPMPTAVVWPSLVGGLEHRLVGEGAGAADDADRALEKMLPGMMPILHSPGVSTPGQFGPISRDLEPTARRFTRTMSSTGMPSVMHTISGTCASIASRIESAAKGGGT